MKSCINMRDALAHGYRFDYAIIEIIRLATYCYTIGKIYLDAIKEAIIY